jgi:SAM-dependent methyltransferase
MIDFDPASFKDPAGRAFHHDNWVCRTLSREARQHFEAARAGGLIDTLIADELIVPAEIVPASVLGLPASTVGEFALKQPRVPLVTYSYEWSFEMLRDAALVVLRILDRALASGFVLKDGNAFNILFDGNVPKLVDILSIEPYRKGAIWAGYSQFCRSFLFPLLLSAYRDLDNQALLRGMLGEVPVRDAAQYFSRADYLKPGVFKDVVLQARLDRSFAAASTAVQATASAHAYPKQALVASVRRLTTIISGLKLPTRHTAWSNYDTAHSYSERDRSAKSDFVDRVLGERRPGRLVDLGCNTGEYSRLALKAASFVISVDMDSRSIDQLYRRLPPRTSISLVVASLLNPTPAMGWQLRERSSLLDRLKCDGFLALALIHHLRITGGVPLDAILTQLFAIAPEGVVEWIDKQDTMVRDMLSLRPDVYDDYTWPRFEAALRARGEIVSVQPTHGGHRRLCHVRTSRR